MQKNREESICWQCARACPKTCSWAEDFIPVEGWTAEYCEKYKSYSVIECPLFEQETKENKCTNIDDRGALKLMQRVLEEAREDYIRSPRLREDLEKWIRKRGAVLCMFEDPEAIIRMLRKDAESYQRRMANRRLV